MARNRTDDRDAGTHRDAPSSKLDLTGLVEKPVSIYTQSHELAHKEKCVPVRPCVPVNALYELALLVRRLSPDRRNPERFHEEKSEIVARLLDLAYSLGAAR